MQMVKKILFVLLLLWGALLLFMPKEELYFSLERELARQGVEINEGSVEEGVFGLTLEDVSIYVRGIKVASVKKISLFTLLFYTKVDAEEILADESLHTMLPERIEEMVFTYSVLTPFTVHIEAIGSFGMAEGTASLKERLIHLDFKELKKADMIRSKLIKGEKGWYYEASF